MYENAHPVERVFANISVAPMECTAAQREWTKLFAAAMDKRDVIPELALLEASVPACAEASGWYQYFLSRADSLLKSVNLSLLESSQVEKLCRVRRRLAAFAGEYTVADKRHSRTRDYAGQTVRKIGIDIRPLTIASSRRRGIGRYLMCTLPELFALGSDKDFVLFTEARSIVDDELKELLGRPNVQFRKLNVGCGHDLDVFLVTDPLPMLRGRRLASLPRFECPILSIVYDFIPLEFPESYLAGDAELTDEYLDNLDFIARECDRIFPISDYVGNQCKAILGFSDDQVQPLYGGIDEVFLDNTSNTFTNCDHAPYFLYVGGSDARKNIAGLIRAFGNAKHLLPANSKLLLVGEFTEQCLNRLLSRFDLMHLSESIVCRTGVSDNELQYLYSNALATVFVSLSEGLGLPALEAMACGCPVIASSTTALGETVGTAALTVDPTAIEDIAKCMAKVATDDVLRKELSASGKEWARRWRWVDVAVRLHVALDNCSFRQKSKVAKSGKLRVALMNRGDVWSAPGGDGRVMQLIEQAAYHTNIDIRYCSDFSMAKEADIVHFVNITLPKPLGQACAFAAESVKPLVITTLYEDWANYLLASHQAFSLYRNCLEGRLVYNDLEYALLTLNARQHAPNPVTNETIEAAAVLHVCSKSEGQRLASDFPLAVKKQVLIPFEIEAPCIADKSVVSQIRNSLGFDEYILCIGRLETRKNQLAVLAALQEVDVPIVFATGGYTPQPAYSSAVRSWKRKAPVRFVDRIPWQAMSALIRGAAAHVLPSFYELPGLVHLECAAAGVPVVATDWGALSDYIPDSLYFKCDPLDLKSIRIAVEKAVSTSAYPGSVIIAQGFTREKFICGLESMYRHAISTFEPLTRRKTVVTLIDKSFVPGDINATV